MAESSDAPRADLPDEQVLRFPDGIPGFPSARRFLLADLTEDATFQVLQSLDEPDLSLVVGVPWLFFPDYSPELSEEDCRDLGIAGAEDAAVFCAVSTGSDDETLFMNLLGPFVVNVRTRVGRQVVLADTSHEVRAAIAVGD